MREADQLANLQHDSTPQEFRAHPSRTLDVRAPASHPAPSYDRRMPPRRCVICPPACDLHAAAWSSRRVTPAPLRTTLLALPAACCWPSRWGRHATGEALRPKTASRGPRR